MNDVDNYTNPGARITVAIGTHDETMIVSLHVVMVMVKPSANQMNGPIKDWKAISVAMTKPRQPNEWSNERLEGNSHRDGIGTNAAVKAKVFHKNAPQTAVRAYVTFNTDQSVNLHPVEEEDLIEFERAEPDPEVLSDAMDDSATDNSSK